LPTTAELTGADVPEGIDGVSFLPTLFGETEKQKQHDHLYWETSGGGGWQAVRKGNWKAHRLITQKPNRTTVELYDLDADIAEEKNVAEQHPDVVASMMKIFEDGRTVPEGRDSLFEAPKKKKK
jgi:arylsulfatase A-like enzyme